MNIAIGTMNKAKVNAVKTVMQSQCLDAVFTPVKAHSLVSDQPMSNEETRQGAINRAQHALTLTDAHIAFGLEGGVTVLEDQLYICNWAALVTADGQSFTAAGAQLPLPIEVAQCILAGEELGPVMERYAAQSDIRQNQGAIGIFTDGLVSRQAMFEHIITLLVGQYRYNQR